MNEILSQLTVIRNNQLGLISKYKLSELNQIPKGFNNNLVWNFGHSIVTQHLLTYGLCNLDLPIDNQLVTSFRKGTTPQENYAIETVEALKVVALDSVKNLAKNISANRFSNFESYQTSFGLKLENFEQALLFNYIHEGLHFGYMLALKNCIDG